MLGREPLVSISCFCKNSARTIRRSIESVLGQTYRNIEFVIQDGKSTDGTIEIIRSYNDDRIKLVSEPDSGIGEAHWKVLNRCQGDILGTCLSDDELLPDAVENAVKRFHAEPHLGAVTGDSYICDGAGYITGEHISADFDLVKYLYGTYCPFFPATFFRRQALLDVGLGSSDWELDSLEYEIWFRIGTQHEIKYFPGFVSKYAIHDKQSSHDLASADIALDGWMRMIDKWFSKEGFFGDDLIRKNACKYNRLYATYNHFRAYNIVEQTEKLYRRILKFRREILHSYSGMEWLVSNSLFSYLDDASRTIPAEHALNFVASVSAAVPRPVKQIFSRKTKQRLRNVLLKYFFFRSGISLAGRRWGRKYWQRLRRHIPGLAKTLVPAFAEAEAGIDSSLKQATLPMGQIGVNKIYSLRPLEYSNNLYTHVANLYHARGQIEQALRMWRAADSKDVIAEGHMCSAILFSPTATNQSIGELQAWWAGRHAIPNSRIPPVQGPPYRSGRQIRIGYHCSWMSATTFLAIMAAVLKAHDRSKVFVIGYSSDPPAYDHAGMLDHFRDTAGLEDEQYLNLVRADKVDILIEISGFSDGNRFAAMASRCAPIQVAYVNHHATTGVPKIDYLLTDEICVPIGEEQFFTEKLYRLPVSFLCYNYEFEKSLPVTPSPNQKGAITFGCFGHGAKLNTELIELWSRILHRVPRSVMLLCNSQFAIGDNKKFVADRFRRFGISPDRLRLINGTHRNEALAYLAEVDVSLDTFPYNGGNVVAESLWHGVPVITLKGSRCASRYGASLLIAAGCRDLIADTPDQYVALAETLSQDPTKLTSYRQDLRDMMYEYGLSDARKFAIKLESAYEWMMNEYHHSQH